MPQWYYEDFEPGENIAVGSRQVTEDEIIAFAQEYDPQSFHMDRAAAQQTHGGIIASGWHTCSLVSRLVVDNLLNDAANIGSPGLDEVRWPRPVRGGDVLKVDVTITDKRVSGSKPDRGLVFMVWRACNQHDEVVVSIKCMVMFWRRPRG